MLDGVDLRAQRVAVPACAHRPARARRRRRRRRDLVRLITAVSCAASDTTSANESCAAQTRESSSGVKVVGTEHTRSRSARTLRASSEPTDIASDEQQLFARACAICDLQAWWWLLLAARSCCVAIMSDTDDTAYETLTDPVKWRRAVLWNPCRTANVPCILCYQFQQDRFGELDVTVSMRSSDVVNILPQDVLMTRMLQNHVASHGTQRYAASRSNVTRASHSASHARRAWKIRAYRCCCSCSSSNACCCRCS